MALWESSLLTRDGVFMQVFLITCLAVWLYRLFPVTARRWLLVVGLGLFTGLFIFSVWNIVTWSPT